MAAVVHHGGAGTTAAGLRAGRPTVVVPFMIDQPFWGARVEALGAGSAPIPQKQLTVEKLAAALRQVTTDAGIQARAAALGEQLRAEDGVGRARAIIEAEAVRGG
ncbi:MAG: glycosyltransferase, partial [Anaerolineae bacterium]|nr:glycosyltransferase [Anaerolineae bacterium]